MIESAAPECWSSYCSLFFCSLRDHLRWKQQRAIIGFLLPANQQRSRSGNKVPLRIGPLGLEVGGAAFGLKDRPSRALRTGNRVPLRQKKFWFLPQATCLHEAFQRRQERSLTEALFKH